MAIGILGLILVLVAAALIVPYFLPADALKARVIAEVERRSGWRLRLDGPVSISLLPSLRLQAADVGFTGAAGMGGAELARAEEVDFGLAWGTLFGGSLQLTHIVLRTPEISLEVGPDGVANWAPRSAFPHDRWAAAAEAISENSTDGAPPPQAAAPTEPATGDGAEETADPMLGLARIGVAYFQVKDGRLLYADRRSGDEMAVDQINATLRLPSLAGALDLDIAARYQGIEAAVSGRVAAPLALARGGASDIDLTTTVAGASLRSTGNLSAAGSGALTLAASGDSVAEPLAALGVALARDPGAYSLAGDVALSAGRVDLDNLVAKIGAAEISGAGSLSQGAGAPAISGRVRLADLDLAEVLQLAGRAEAATGALGGDLAFSARGGDAAALLGSLDLRGSLRLARGSIGGLVLPAPLGEDPASATIEDIAADVEIAGLDRPVSLTGGLRWRGETFQLSGTAEPALLLAGLPAPVRVRVESGRVGAGYDGAVSAQGALDGDLFLETADLRGLAAWLGSPLPPGGGLKAFSIAGRLGAAPGAVAFTDARIRLDDISGTGKGEIRLSDPPLITAALALDRLGLDPYLTGGGNAQVPARAGGKTSARAPSGGPAPWSTDPIDLSGLKAVDANLELSARTIAWDKVEVGPSRLTVALKGGRLTADLADLTLYEGSGRGTLTLDGAGPVPVIEAAFDLVDVNAHPFLSALIDFRWLEGRVGTALALRARGASQADLVASLGGTARFDFVDGAVRGINIPRMVRGLTVDTLLGWAENPAQKTDFSSLGLGFEIANGVARSTDLALAGPLVRMSGTGLIDLPRKSLDWRFEPKVVATLEGAPPMPRGKGEDRELAGLGVPVIVRGPWDRPKIYPDIKGILDDPKTALKQLEGIGGGLAEVLKRQPEKALTDAANDVIGRVTGGGSSIDVQKVIDGEVDDKEVLDAVEQGFGLPSGFLGSFGIGKGPKQEPDAAPPQQ
ncbi:AsmA family protein [Stappia taiwanensis]|uniref:AsmA family protein n=1 Tax=Stappia taiwanensis TaxID=992267 RepID=A0A838XX84_9HYPH|nr:AsmA family protein [Stappia taiwanensis]MBA4611400.1 AsmA family protein [Stappia taiwanensis]